jgi:hypothetical protein
VSDNAGSRPSVGLSRRTVVGATAGLVGAAAFRAFAPRPAFGQSPRTRYDIITFAQDAVRLSKFEAAVKQMQDASTANPADVKGWLANANKHRDFCSIAKDDPSQIHFCWWFLAWHRASIYVTEQKIRALSGDDSLSYPYWNWSSDRTIPVAFAKSGSPLANAVRYPRTQPFGLQDGEVGYNQSDPTLKAFGVSALSASFFQAASFAEIPLSFGGIARPNTGKKYGNNALEAVPHGPVHNYSGGQKLVGGKLVYGDMTDFSTAARDPIFFAHHGNLDRLWETWRQTPANKKSEPQDATFQNHSFVFTWLDGTPVEVKMSDILDTTKLGYSYDYLDVFRNKTPPILVAEAVTSSSPLPPIATQKISIPSARPSAARPNAALPERQYLEILGVQSPTVPMTVGVFLKEANAAPNARGIEVGTFAAVLSGGTVAWPSDRLLFDVTAPIERFAGQDVTVELIPERMGSDPDQTYPPLRYEVMRIITQESPIRNPQ